MQPRDGTEAIKFSVLRPSTRRLPQIRRTVRQEAKKRAEASATLTYWLARA